LWSAIATVTGRPSAPVSLPVIAKPACASLALTTLSPAIAAMLIVGDLSCTASVRVASVAALPN
jgi:hypothetical protein